MRTHGNARSRERVIPVEKGEECHGKVRQPNRAEEKIIKRADENARTAKRSANSLPTWNKLLAEGVVTLREVAWIPGNTVLRSGKVGGIEGGRGGGAAPREDGTRDGL